MSAGYGRGYYGEEQLARVPRRGGVGGWVKLALVVGVGGVIWFMWPRGAKLPPEIGHAGDEPVPPTGLPPLSMGLPSPAFVPSLAGAPQPMGLPAPAASQIAQMAQERGYPSTKEYEDAVVASAKQLQEAGGQVVLAPHLAHLAPRLGS